MGFSGVNNFPTHTIIDGHFRGVLEETGMSVKKEYEMVALARKMDLFSIVYVGTPDEAVEMAKSGADAIIAHVKAEALTVTDFGTPTAASRTRGGRWSGWSRRAIRPCPSTRTGCRS